MPIPTKEQTRWKAKHLLCFLASLTNCNRAQLTVIKSGSLVRNGLLVKPKTNLQCPLPACKFLNALLIGIQMREVVISEDSCYNEKQKHLLVLALVNTIELIIHLQENHPKDSYRGKLHKLEYAQKCVDEVLGAKSKPPRFSARPSKSLHQQFRHQGRQRNISTPTESPSP